MYSRAIHRKLTAACGVLALLVACAGRLSAQAPAPSGGRAAGAPSPAGSSAQVGDAYVIGLGDVLDVYVHDEPQLTGTLTVRSDGKITLFMLNDLQAAGLTPEQLRSAIAKAATAVREGPAVTVRVNQSKSKFITVIGEVVKVGEIPMSGPMTVAQALGAAGGFTEFAKKGSVLIVRKVDGEDRTFKFNYNDFAKGKNLKQNIELKPGDQIVVP